MGKNSQKINDKLNEDVTADEVNNFNYSNISSKAMAMAKTMVGGFGKALEKLSNENSDFNNSKDDIYKSVIKAIEDLAQGNFLDSTFEADAFGV